MYIPSKNLANSRGFKANTPFDTNGADSSDANELVGGWLHCSIYSADLLL